MDRKAELQQLVNRVGFDRALVERPVRNQYRVFVWDWNQPRMFSQQAGGWIPLVPVHVSFTQAKEIILNRATDLQEQFPGTKRV